MSIQYIITFKYIKTNTIVHQTNLDPLPKPLCYLNFLQNFLQGLTSITTSPNNQHVLLPPQPHIHKGLMYKLSKFPKVKEFLPLSPLPSITSLTNWLISRSMLLFQTWLSSQNNKSILGSLWKENLPPQSIFLKRQNKRILL